MSFVPESLVFQLSQVSVHDSGPWPTQWSIVGIAKYINKIAREPALFNGAKVRLIDVNQVGMYVSIINHTQRFGKTARAFARITTGETRVDYR